MKRDLSYWRFVYRTSGGWRGVWWCLNCLYGPRAWVRIVLHWRRRRLLKVAVRKMTPEQRMQLITDLNELAKGL